MTNKPLIIIGAGAAGMMAAGHAASRGLPVLVLECNGQAGAKLSITGKGRCNLTNDCTPDEFLEGIAFNGRFLYSALAQFPPSGTMSFFEGLGLLLKTERGRRVFPKSGRASDLVSCLYSWNKRQGVIFRFNTRATGLGSENGSVSGVYASNEFIPAENVVVACGGMSFPKTGSTGDGYELAKQAGHTIATPRPSLVPFNSPNGYCRDLQGLALKNVTLRLSDSNGKTLFSDGPGEVLFTHFGISGPLALSASAHWENGANINIDLKPGMSEKMLDARILRDFKKYHSKILKNSLSDLLPGGIIPVIISLSDIAEDKKISAITKAERLRLLNVLKNFPIRISGTRTIQEAIITRGGVVCHEIHPKTLESKLCRGLYFAGEVIDLDGYTGGYNLQIAWSTGYVAGINAGRC